MTQRILVSGGAGFLGSHLCERLLAEGHEVICADNFFTGSRKNIVPLLAHPSEVHPQTEDYWGRVNPIGLRSCYDEGKRCAESLFFAYRLQHRMPVKVIRIFNTYGPRMSSHDGRVISNFIVQALKGEDITVYGRGNQTRSFCYVDDLIDAVMAMRAAPEDFTGPVNIGNPDEMTVRDLAERIIRLTGSRSKIILKPLPQDDPLQRQPDITLAKKMLRWEPRISLEEGLGKTIAYFKSAS